MDRTDRVLYLKPTKGAKYQQNFLNVNSITVQTMLSISTTVDSTQICLQKQVRASTLQPIGDLTFLKTSDLNTKCSLFTVPDDYDFRGKKKIKLSSINVNIVVSTNFELK